MNRVDTGAVFRCGGAPFSKGKHTVAFRFEGSNNHHGHLDCLLPRTVPFAPRGGARPDEQEKAVEQVEDLAGLVQFPRADAGRLEATGLNFNGCPATELGAASEIRLKPRVLFYLIVP
ncbi:MAG TPA: hypothetical protein PKY77_18560 [Phycisphaerae bacterium]|nr:hypothetical protein [Phycisphaerae bacterium]HRY69129.1 hypothetical protein [Phycisphaerae bacterium]HSA26090.1 hypothetical protein [Phycisphaerae bacterium]